MTNRGSIVRLLSLFHNFTDIADIFEFDVRTVRESRARVSIGTVVWKWFVAEPNPSRLIEPLITA